MRLKPKALTQQATSTNPLPDSRSINGSYHLDDKPHFIYNINVNALYAKNIRTDAPFAIIGGLGPLASTRFLSTIYSLARVQIEQELPKVFLLSDPSIPDRTSEFLRGNVSEITSRIERAAAHALSIGCSHGVVCCFTAHHIYERLPEKIRSFLVPLHELACTMIHKTGKETLILCTTGSKKLRVFNHAKSWAKISSKVQFLSEEDQEHLHQQLYKLKLNKEIDKTAKHINKLIAKYQPGAVLFGCTELHLLSNKRNDDIFSLDVKIIDPLNQLAEWLANRIPLPII